MLHRVAFPHWVGGHEIKRSGIYIVVGLVGAVKYDAGKTSLQHVAPARPHFDCAIGEFVDGKPNDFIFLAPGKCEQIDA
ncbi:hypothetical protein AW736_09140 [Termitidicoccus mucosus]|uniref:Uncharacterized protein n=1 Tax=Termitidicoccus mucosus TaxID=1184151 RepID=A0A178IGT2_9BACT|nr:hypothetical protein AW736_09140 [Opitutaceae bacterium TSB47]